MAQFTLINRHFSKLFVNQKKKREKRTINHFLYHQSLNNKIKQLSNDHHRFQVFSLHGFDSGWLVHARWRLVLAGSASSRKQETLSLTTET